MELRTEPETASNLKKHIIVELVLSGDSSTYVKWLAVVWRYGVGIIHESMIQDN